MFVRVDPANAEVSLEEPDDFGRFHLEAVGDQPIDAIVATLGDDGRVHNDDHVWVSVAALRRWAAGTAGKGWDDGFEKMLGYARSKGWTDDDASHIQAHVEHADS